MLLAQASPWVCQTLQPVPGLLLYPVVQGQGRESGRSLPVVATPGISCILEHLLSAYYIQTLWIQQ